jgi:uncharacterized protein with GYD domain
MASYVSLFNFTAKGAENFRESPSRAIAFANSAKKAGCKVREIYWTVGNYDGVLIFEAASDEAATSVLLSLAALGNVRTTTLRAFTAAEMKGIVAKAPKL